MRELHYDVVIVGCGVGGLYTALNLPEDKQILMLSKAELETCDSMLAQGGICVLRDEDDYDSYFEDTMRAGHYENRKESVDIMIRGSRDVINDLIGYGVQFERNEDGSLAYTKEGAHSKPRICFHEDITGEEITTHLLSAVKQLKNVTIFEHTTMTDLIEDINHTCVGILAKRADPRFRLAGSVLAASSFAVFFGGSLWDGLLAGVIAVLVFWMERCLAPFCMNGVEFQFIASFCCGISTLLFCRTGPQLHADKILIGIIMLLIPGIMLTNSIRDILLGDIISGSLRLVEAILMAAVLALGMMAAIWLMGGIA